jgi:hypothetical protein
MDAIKAIMNEGPLKKSSFAQKKRGSVDSTKNSTKKLSSSKRNLASTFSLYGLNSSTPRSPNWAKLANIKTMNPSDAANKYYDKSIT